MSVLLRTKKLANGRSSLFLDFHLNGKRIKEYLNLYITNDRSAKNQNSETLRLAENIRAKRQLELDYDEHGFVPKFKRESDFIAYFRLQSAKKHRTWKSTLLQLEKYSGGVVPFSKVDERWLERFQDFLLETVSNNTGLTYINKVKACLNMAVRDRIIRENPFIRVKTIKKLENEHTFLTLQELRTLAQTSCSDAEVKRAFLFCCFTGLRFSDVNKLNWGNVRGDQLHFTQKKTSGKEYLPLSESALKYLGTPKSGDSLVFILPPDWKAWEHLQIWAKAANLEKHLSFHVSRHTFATLALTSGVDLYTVSKLLGHTSIKNTQIYAKIIDQKKKIAVNMLPQI